MEWWMYPVAYIVAGLITVRVSAHLGAFSSCSSPRDREEERRIYFFCWPLCVFAGSKKLFAFLLDKALDGVAKEGDASYERRCQIRRQVVALMAEQDRLKREALKRLEEETKG